MVISLRSGLWEEYLAKLESYKFSFITVQYSYLYLNSKYQLYIIIAHFWHHKMSTSISGDRITSFG